MRWRKAAGHRLHARLAAGLFADGCLYSHLTWHLALVELQEGEEAAAFQRYTES
jgi:hypothetical protein